MMTIHYTLERGVVREAELIEWAQWIETANRRVAGAIIGDVRISTVFLGLNHNFEDTGDPVLFETMIFGGEHDGLQVRYTNLEAAMQGHERAVALVDGN